MKALALHHQPPRSDLRVLVGGDLDDAAIEPYLAVRSRVTRTPTGGNPDRREHARLPADTSGLPTHRAGDADLVLLTTSPAISMDVVVTAVAAALAPGGLAVLAVPGPAARSLLGSIAAHGLMLREHERSSGDTSSTEVLVLADARAVVPLPLGGLELDRSACVDREQIHRLAARGRWRGPRPSQGPSSIDPLLDALHRQLTTGEIDIWRLPWPSASPSSTSKDSGCDVLAVMPHPDDESVYAGGTLAGLVAAGQRVKLVVATDGAGGRGGSDLGRRRAHELWLASHALGLDGVRCLAWSDFGKYRDGSRTAPVTAADALRTWGLDVALADVVAEIRRARPRRLLGLGPEVDPNFSLHGHHLGLGVVLAVAFHAAADERFAPQLGPAWACAEHRVMAPLAHASAADAFEVPRAAKIRALRAHTSQSYSTAGLIDALADVRRPAIEVCRVLQRRETLPWILARADPGSCPPIEWHARAERVRAVDRPRAAVVAALRRQASASPHDEAVEVSLRRLLDPGSVAIVTGQQVGALGGPVYTLAKALGAVALARRLTRRGIEAVPVFWMASQDHDLAEVQRIPRLEGSTLSLGNPDRGRSVGTLPLGPEIDATVDRWCDGLGPHAREISDLLRHSHRASTDFASAFRSLLQTVTRGTGLLLLDPADPALTRLAEPLLSRALREAPRVDHALERARERLQGREVIAVRRGATQVFFVDDDGRRRRISYQPDRPAASHWLEAVRADPCRASAAALLRPLVQDTLLPTLAYVAGPTERRYLAQLDELYHWARLPVLVTVPRPTLRLASSGDIESLREVGGLDGLDRAARPLEVIGCAGLSPAERRWLDAIETFIAALPGPDGVVPQRSTATLRRLGAELDARAPSCGPGRTAMTWPRRRTRLSARIEAAAADPSPHLRGRLRGELLRLRRSLLRDGRRAHADAVSAWRRVGSDPAPAERRMTVAEWVARMGTASTPTILAALAKDPSAAITLTVGGRR